MITDFVLLRNLTTMYFCAMHIYKFNRADNKKKTNRTFLGCLLGRYVLGCLLMGKIIITD